MSFGGPDIHNLEGLQQWLEQIGYGHIFEPLQSGDINICSLADLLNYRHEDYSADQSIKKLLSDLGVGILLRRKFLQQINTLRNAVGDLASPPQAEVRDEEEKATSPAATEPEQNNLLSGGSSSSIGEQKRKSVQMNRAEDQAVSRLTSAIKAHTVAIQKLEPNMGEVRNEAQALRREIEERFETIRSSFELAKAQLVKNLTLAESDAVNKVQAELGSMKQSAVTLLKCHKEVTAPLSEAVDDGQRRERAQFVVTKIAGALTDAPSSTYEHHLLFQQEDVNFEELFANYGKIIIQRKKIRANSGGGAE